MCIRDSDKLVEEISQFYTPDLVLIRTALNGFSVLLVRAFDGMEYGETGAHGLMNGFNTVMNIKQAKEQLHAIYRECLKQRSGEDKKYSALVLAVLQYVRGNVYGDISLERTARYFKDVYKRQVRSKREKAKSQGIKERIAEETKELHDDNRELIIKMTVNKNF